MPLTQHQPEFDRLYNPCGPAEVTAYLPRRFAGWSVAEMTVHIRANYDETFTDDLAADVFIEDDTGKRHAIGDKLARVLLRMIKKTQPEIWREIKELAESNYLEGAEPDFITMGR